VLPSEAYGEDDIPLFDRVSAAVHSDVTARTAHDIVADLRNVRGKTDSLEAILLRVTDDLPGLRFLIPALYPKHVRPVHRMQIARGLGMVLTLVSARLRRFEASSTGKPAARSPS
jgi:hypothetical protein